MFNNERVNQTVLESCYPNKIMTHLNEDHLLIQLPQDYEVEGGNSGKNV